MKNINMIGEKTPYVKRFLEQYLGDRVFRQSLTDGNPTWHRSIKDIDYNEIRCFWDTEFDNEPPSTRTVDDFKAFNAQKITWRKLIRDSCEPINDRFAKWRMRQMNRCNLELGPVLNERLIHTPIMFELSDGCSVGCPFCAFKAKKLEDVFLYTEENAKLWQELLGVVEEVIGEAAKWGCCYFATDPLDNPDYEKFCMDYANIVGAFPQTTTALPLKDVDRTKRILKLSRENGGEIDRFSVLTLKSLHRIFDEFTPEELTFVELVLQNNETDQVKSASGRYLEKVKKDETLKSKKAIMGKSISCLTGFMVNMCHRTVQLIAPCEATEEWPLGYMVYGEKSFSNSEEFRAILESMISDLMRNHISEEKRIALRPTLTVVEEKDEVQIKDNYHVISVKYKEKDKAYMGDLFQYLHVGEYSANTLGLLQYYGHGVEEKLTYDILQKIYEQGFVKEMTINEPRS